MNKGDVQNMDRVLIISSTLLGDEIAAALEKGDSRYLYTTVKPEDADALISQEEFSAIILDASDSLQDSLLISKKIRFVGGHIPVISVGDCTETEAEGSRETIDRWVKPGELQTLSETLDEVISEPRHSLKLSMLRALTAKLLSALPISIIALNSKGELWYTNKHARNLFRIDFSAIGTPVWKIEALRNILPSKVVSGMREGSIEEHHQRISWIDFEGEERFFQLELHPMDKGDNGHSMLLILSECTAEERERLHLLESRQMYASSLELLKRMFSAPTVDIALEGALSLIKSDFHCDALFYLETNGEQVVKATRGIAEYVSAGNIPCLQCKAYREGKILFGNGISDICPVRPRGRGSWCFPIHLLDKKRPQGIFRSEITEQVRFPNLVEISMVHLSSEIGLVLQRFTLFKQIALAKREWEETFDAILNPILLVDKNRKISRVNRAFASLVGREMKELVGENCYEVLYESDPPVQDCPLQACLEGKEQVDREIYIPAVNREFIISVFKTRDDDNDPIFVHTMKDITELKKTQAQLFYTSKLASLGQMAAAIAHEINNPMAAISGFAEILLDEVEDPSHKRYLNNIVQAAQRVGNTIKATLLLTETSNDDNINTVDLNETIKEALSVVTPLASKAGIVINDSLGNKNIMVMGNRQLLLQAILAFLQNAIDSIEENEHSVAKVVTVFTEKGLAGESIAEISDTGTGIPQHVKPRIFDPFFSTKGYGKTGLGLSVAKSIIDRFGGRIEVDTDIGLGTSFRIIFPATQFLTDE